MPPNWYATVELDRDAYIHRIWYDGYSGDSSWGGGPHRVTLFVPFPHVKATVEALRVAELDYDFSRFHALADRLALPSMAGLLPASGS
ncbi:hypothetical protein [Streptomyces sp. MBT62]|uniref:hypothetical protein n=1 Tax=Streptomyces sp. MBT62 TaxID=2800410 RepID=UPI00190B5D3D|nr:hypothetical protein [Streptomyces sp. MBT62]MBK3567078.1 hypothetical protein [Streptomyces sp. MBT62]